MCIRDRGKVINSFCENTDGTIWIGTDNKGLWNYNPHDQSFTPVYLDAKNPDLSVHALYCDHHELWVGTYAHGVYRLNSATGKVTNYSDKNIKGLNPGSVYAIYKDSSGRLWFGTQTGILYYDIFSNSFVTIADPVSYTHLDVYKRQVIPCLSQSIIRIRN